MFRKKRLTLAASLLVLLTMGIALLYVAPSLSAKSANAGTSAKPAMTTTTTAKTASVSVKVQSITDTTPTDPSNTAAPKEEA